jgi:type II secretory pathway pseudopilin PulG
MKKINFKNKGFTIPEVLTAMLTFVVLFLIIITSFVLAMRFMNTTEKKIAANNTCQGALDMIVSEVRQGTPNLDPGYGRTPSGYLAIKPPIAKTAILKPNSRAKKSSEIVFNQPNFAKLGTMTTSNFVFDRIRPEAYQQVKYYVGTSGENKGKLIREANPIGTGSNLMSGTRSVIAEAELGEFIMETQYVSPKSFEIKLQIVRKSGNKIDEVLASYSSLVTTVVD